MANAKPDMSGLKPFEAGESGNPGGKTSAQRTAEISNAESATRLRGRMLAGLERELKKADDAHAEAVANGDSDEVEAADAALGMINANILKLLKDSEDRGLGTPVQSVNVESPNGTMTPRPSMPLTNLSEADLDILERLTDKAANPDGAGEAD